MSHGTRQCGAHRLKLVDHFEKVVLEKVQTQRLSARGEVQRVVKLLHRGDPSVFEARQRAHALGRRGAGRTHQTIFRE